MSDLLKNFSFDLQRFVEITPIAGQSGLMTDVAFDEIGGLSSDVEKSSDSSFDGKFFWNGDSPLIDGTFDGGTSGVQLSVKYDVYQVTGLSGEGVSADDTFTFYNITGVSEIDLSGPNDVKFTKISSGSESNIIIASDSPVSLHGISINDFNFSSLAAAGNSFSLDEIVLTTDIAGYSYPFVDSVSFTNGTMYVSEHIKNLTVNGGSDLLTVDKPFYYTVNGDDNILSLVEEGTSVGSFDGATKIVPVEATDAAVNITGSSYAYTSGGSAAFIVNSNGVEGFEFAKVGDAVSFPALGESATVGYGIRTPEDEFIDGDLNFAALSKDGYTAELTEITPSGSGSDTTTSYAIDITPNSTKVALSESLALNSNNISKGDVITINGDGEITAVRLTQVGDAISGDITNFTGDSTATVLKFGTGSDTLGVNFEGIGSSAATLTYETADTFKLSGLAAEDEINLGGVNYAFEAVGASGAEMTFTTAGELSNITANDGTAFTTEGLSALDNPTVNVNNKEITSNVDFTYRRTNADDVLISIDEDGANLQNTGDATRVVVSSDAATILGSKFSNISFGSESSGFVINNGQIAGVTMTDDGDTFTTNNAGIDITGVTMAGLSNLADEVTFTRNGSASDAGTAIEVRGFGDSSVVESNDGTIKVEVTKYASRGTDVDVDEILAISFNTSGVVTNVSNTNDGDIIKVSGASAGITFEDSSIIVKSGEFIYDDEEDTTLRLVNGPADSVDAVGAVDKIDFNEQTFSEVASTGLLGETFNISSDEDENYFTFVLGSESGVTSLSEITGLDEGASLKAAVGTYTVNGETLTIENENQVIVGTAGGTSAEIDFRFQS